jgi:hypothetical protein
MTDIVERLRLRHAVVPSDNTLCDEAADEIERLQAELNSLRKAEWAQLVETHAEIERLQQRLGEAEARIATDALLIGHLCQGLR